MTSFVVMESPAAAGGERPSLYVRDGFHIVAFLVPPLWLLWHRLWIEAALAFAVMLALSTLGSVVGIGSAAPALSLLVSFYVGLEGAAMHVATLRRRGWTEWGVVDADNRDEAEIRHLFAAAPLQAPEIEPALPISSFSPPRPAPSGPALGLFAYPGQR